MTLVVAGFDVKGELFFIADSAISNKRQSNSNEEDKDTHKTIMSRFKKVYELPIMVHQPYFVRHFSYYHPFRECRDNVMFAIAGSTLIAQNVMNSITNYLRNIRVDFIDDSCAEFCLKTYCDLDVVLACAGYEYDRDYHEIPFKKIVKLINKDNLKKIMELAISHAIKELFSFFKEKELQNNQYLFAFYCNQTMTNYLYQIDIVKVQKTFNEDNERKYVIELDVKEIHVGSLGIIGSHKYDDELKEFYSQQYQQGSQNLSQEMFDKFYSIVEQCERDCKGIERPIVYKKFDRGQVIEQWVGGEENRVQKTKRVNILDFYKPPRIIRDDENVIFDIFD